MISIDVRKEIFIKRFIKFQSYRSISKDLNINRQTITNVCNNISKKIKQLRLDEYCNLIDYIDKLVIQPQYKTKRKSHKLNLATKKLIKSIVESNEIKRTRENKNAKTIVALYTEFQKSKKYDKDGNNIYKTDITYNHFYKLVTRIKKDFLEPKTLNIK